MADRLSELPNDLLRRILHFAPLKEAASTTALSRRWRTPLLRLSSAAVNLEPHIPKYYRYEPEYYVARFCLFAQRDAFITEAVEALDAADIPITRLILRLESDYRQDGDDFLNRESDRDGVVVSRDMNLVEVLLSHPAARRVEELRVVFKLHGGYTIGYTAFLDTLPLETIRVLELTDCRGLYQRQAVALVIQRLSSLQLRNRAQDLGCLQRVIDAAPALAEIRLKSVYIYTTPPRPRWPKTDRLRCPAATMLVLDRCRWEEKNRSGADHTINCVEIDAPRLRCFRYIGLLRSLLFSSQPLELEQVDLHADRWAKDPDLDLATFSRLARSFTNTKEMRLWVNHREEVAVLTEESRVELLPAFRRLRLLELRGVHWTKGDTAAVTIVNLLRCCPVLCALRISLAAKHEAAADTSNKKGPRSRVPLKIMQIPTLGLRHALECLQSSLTIVGLQFLRDESDSFALKLIEFFAENAIVLKEMHIDEKFYEHINYKAKGWNSKRRKSGATCFVVLPS